MRNKILLIIIVLLIFTTGCGKNKSDAKYIENEYSKDIKILSKIDVTDKDSYDENMGFVYKIEYFILDVDQKNKLVDVFSTPLEFRVTNLNSNHKYYRLYNNPFTINIKNKFYKKKTYIYNASFFIEINNPQIFWNKKYTSDMNVEDFYNKKLKKIIDKYLNKAISKCLNDNDDINLINLKELNDEFNNLIGKDNGFTIKIQNIEFIAK